MGRQEEVNVDASERKGRRTVVQKSYRRRSSQGKGRSQYLPGTWYVAELENRKSAGADQTVN